MTNTPDSFYEQKLREVLSVVQDYLPPGGLGLGINTAMSRIIGIVDPWPAPAAGSSPLTQAPVGWKLVPVEPTDAMVGALIRALNAKSDVLASIGRPREPLDDKEIYRAMVEAAPLPNSSPPAGEPVAWRCRGKDSSGRWSDWHHSEGQPRGPAHAGFQIEPLYTSAPPAEAAVEHMTEMTLEEARRIVAEEDTSDLARTLQAVAMVLRFNGIADARLLPIAGEIESVAESVGRGAKT